MKIVENQAIIVSFFERNISQVKPTKNIEINEFLHWIKEGKFKPQIEKIRNLPAEEQEKLKKETLAYVTLSGTFDKRNEKALLHHSGLIQVDLDLVPDTEKARKQIIEDKHTFACFTSVRAGRLKVIFKIEPDAQTHKSSFLAIEKYFREHFGLEIDTACKDVSRSCFVSYDPDIYINSDAQLFPPSFNLLPIQQNKILSEPLQTPDSFPESEQSQPDDNYKESQSAENEETKPNDIWQKVFEGCQKGVTSEHAIYFREGERNDFLFHLANALNRYGMPHSIALQKTTACYACSSLPEEEISDTLKSAYQNTSEHAIYVWNDKRERKQTAEFYTVTVDKNGRKDIQISYLQLIETLRKYGFCRFDTDNDDFVFVLIEKNIIEIVSRHYLIDTFFSSILRKIPEQLIEITRLELQEKMYKGLDTYFSRNLLARLINETPFNFVKDTADKAFFYFKNGFVQVEKSGISFRKYEELEGFIWKSQIIPYDFTLLPTESNELYTQGNFASFCFCIAKEDKINALSLSSIIGYLLHDYAEGKRKAVNFTDSTISENPEGRTGKTLLAKGLGKLRVYDEINGKDYKPDDKHKYQTCNLDTQLVCLNDVRARFRLEDVYNDITEGLRVERKNQQPFVIKPKMIITSNRPLRVESASDRDRIIEFEFSDYFSDKKQPRDVFGQWFFTDWDKEEWNKFFNYLISCVKLYLDKGILLPKNENLNQRKLLEETHSEFIEFMTFKKIEFHKEYDKKQLFEDFLSLYPDWKEQKDRKLSQRAFTSWLYKFAKYSDGFAEVDRIKDTYRSETGKEIIVFCPATPQNKQ